MLKRLASLIPFQKRQFDAAIREPARRVHRNNVPPVVSGSLRPYDGDIQTALSLARAVARQAYENDPYARRAVRVMRNQVVGAHGLMLSLDGDYADEVARAWEQWSGPGFEVTGMSRADVERAIYCGMFYDGEGFAMFDRAGRCTVVDPVRVPVHVWAEPGTRMGIRFDDMNRPVQYAVQSINRERSSYRFAHYSPSESIWVDARDMLHVFDRSEYIEASRGFPRLAAAVGDGEVLRAYRSAELQSAQLQARNRGYLVDSPSGANAVRSDARRVSQDGAAQASAVEVDDLDDESVLYRLPNGVSYLSAASDHPSKQYGEFIKAQLRTFASAAGVPYSQMANDIAGANFSSLRSERLVSAALADEDAVLLADQLTKPLFVAWLRGAMMRGDIMVPMAEYSRIVANAKFLMPVPANLQPREEERARELRLAMGITSPQEEIISRGGNPARVIAERAEWLQMQRAAGLEPEMDMNMGMGNAGS